MSTHPKASTKGRYRQFRLTCTQEASGRVSFSAYAKGIGDEWHERQCILRSSVQFGARLDTTEDVLCALMAVLEETMVPPIYPIGKTGPCPVCGAERDVPDPL